MKKWGIALGTVLLVVLLYYIEISKVNTSNSGSIPTLDKLKADDVARGWDPFYRVRAVIIDGQSADFSIPKELKALEGEEMSLTGAAVFFGNGCKTADDRIAVHSFFLLPTLGLAEACVLQPDVAMRWTVQVNLNQNWIIDRNDMIGAMIRVTGTFRIDTQKPYEAAFFLEKARAKIITE